uniref:B30.2/SPRY domain-containing protein n=1 Tax=Sinocyclocheilus anshuiensis TaxID=1608454 RepID=A0A671SA57_9TELE
LYSEDKHMRISNVVIKTLKIDSSVEELYCPVCYETFKAPVILSCSHSVCKERLQQFWRIKKTQECPSIPKERDQTKRRLSGTEEPACVVCFTSQKHMNHTVRPIREAVSSYKVRQYHGFDCLLSLFLNWLSTLQSCEIHTLYHTNTVCTKPTKPLQIKQQFEMLHQFLRDEEDATITALREEEEQKKQMMKEKLEEMKRHISALSHTIKDTEEMMKRGSGKLPQATAEQRPDELSHQCLNKSYDGHQVRSCHPPITKPFLADCFLPSAPVILDPNTAHPWHILSADLTSVRGSWNCLPLPDNPERFDIYPCVLGSEGFNSGTHCWDMEVNECPYWCLGITTASNQRKGFVFFRTGVWSVQYGLFEAAGFPVEQRLERVRVDLDYDRGTVSFSDTVTNTHIHTLTTTFTDTVFPFFCCYGTFPLRILPFNSL